jgi:hypothetical protein
MRDSSARAGISGALSDPGIDDSRNRLLWSPDAPNLIKVQLELGASAASW